MSSAVMFWSKSAAPATQSAPHPSIFLAASLVIIWLASAVPGAALFNLFTSVANHEVKLRHDHPRNASSNTKEIMNTQMPAPFYDVLRKALKKRGTNIEKICPGSDAVARRVLEDYGAMFVASKKVLPPPACVFTSEDQVTKFQQQAGVATETIADAEIELQPEAMKQLLKAREQANKESLDITPRGGTEAARRNFEDSMRLWDTRFLPALDYWVGQGRLTAEQATRLRALPLHEQVTEVLDLEKNEIYFSKDLSKSILYSIAAPGTSQHIAMLALDVSEFQNARVRAILAEHGWFQTVLSDLPHFTFLGLKEDELPQHGLKSAVVNEQTFWIPNVKAN
jgi:hypothetical protein